MNIAQHAKSQGAQLKCQITPGRRQSKTLINTIDERRSKLVRNRVVDCHLSPDWRQIAIENTVSSDFDPRSSIYKSVFDCRLPSVQMRQLIALSSKEG